MTLYYWIVFFSTWIDDNDIKKNFFLNHNLFVFTYEIYAAGTLLTFHSKEIDDIKKNSKQFPE